MLITIKCERSATSLMGYNPYQSYDSNFADLDDEKISKLNSGGLINIRMDFLWRETQKHCRVGQYSLWNADLDCIWMELAGEYEEGSKEYLAFEQIDMELSETNVKNWGGNQGFCTTTDENKKLMTKQYRLLMKKALFLRRLQNKQGKGTAYSDGSEDDWE